MTDGVKGEPTQVCPACAGGVFRPAEPGFVRCAQCGLFQQAVRRDPARLQDEIDAHYVQAVPSDAKPFMDCRGCEYEIAFLRRHCDPILRGGRALDVGTSLGDFVACLGASGMTASGVEPDRRRAEIGRSHGLDVREGRFGGSVAAQFGAERFDLVSMRECICYFDDFDDALATVRRMLTERGFLYVKVHVADSPYYWGRIPLLRRVGRQCTAFFTTKQLLRTLRTHGFSIVATENNDFPPAFATEAWGLSPAIVRHAQSALRFFARMTPPDRLLVLARPIDRTI
jgi:SAM-dependent methyltransferase